jgi:excisionase family DNA binding protein
MRIEIDVPDELFEKIAEKVAERVEALATAGGGRQYMDAAEAARYLACSKQRIYDLTSRREIPFFKFGSRLLFERRDIDAWLAQARVEPDPVPGLPIARPLRPQTRSAHRSKERPTRRKCSASTRAKSLPSPLSFTEEQNERAAKALGLSRQEFDQLDPRRSAELWEERVRRLGLLSEEQNEVLLCIAPVEAPAPRTGASDPIASSTVSRSAARVSRFGGGTLRVDAPLLRRSWMIRRANSSSWPGVDPSPARPRSGRRCPRRRGGP